MEITEHPINIKFVYGSIADRSVESGCEEPGDKILNFPRVHTQSVERCVELVTGIGRECQAIIFIRSTFFITPKKCLLLIPNKNVVHIRRQL